MRGCGWLKQNIIVKPQEIRIGNFVSFFNNDILKVSAVFENGIHDKHYNGYEYNDIHPIPLNEKWLLDFGFKEEEKNLFTLRQSPIIFNVHKNLISNEFMIRMVTNYSFLVENVHHLQNLFFEIAKQELKLKKENGL